MPEMRTRRGCWNGVDVPERADGRAVTYQASALQSLRAWGADADLAVRWRRAIAPASIHLGDTTHPVGAVSAGEAHCSAALVGIPVGT